MRAFLVLACWTALVAGTALPAGWRGPGTTCTEECCCAVEAQGDSCCSPEGTRIRMAAACTCGTHDPLGKPLALPEAVTPPREGFGSEPDALELVPTLAGEPTSLAPCPETPPPRARRGTA